MPQGMNWTICLCLGFCIPYLRSPSHPCPYCNFSARCHFYPPHMSQESCYLWLVEQNQMTKAGFQPPGGHPSVGALEKAFCLMMGSFMFSPVSCPFWPPLASYQWEGQEILHPLLVTDGLLTPFLHVLYSYSCWCKPFFFAKNTWKEGAKGHPLHCQFGNSKYHSVDMFAKGHKVSLISIFPLLYNQDLLLLKSKIKTLKVSLKEHENI